MNLQHEAILSLNTRVRRLRYLYKALEFVSDTSVSRQLLVRQFVEYGLSRSLYDEITNSMSEPYSGHFFENVSQTYETNMEKREKRRQSNAERVAESYIDLGLKLGLLVEGNQRLSASQLSMPIRFIAGGKWLPMKLQTKSRNRYLLALLWRFDRDLTCPMLNELLRAPSGVKINCIEADWNTWEKNWIEKLIAVSSTQNLGNPAALLRYISLSAKTRKQPKRYAEHTALIRFHWLIDLGAATGQPSRNPTTFVPELNTFGQLRKILAEPPSYVVDGDIARIHFNICKVIEPSEDRGETPIKFSQVISEFLQTARSRGSANVRLNLLDILWTSIISVTSRLPGNFRDFCENVDKLLKFEGITVVKAPRREETYIPTRQ